MTHSTARHGDTYWNLSCPACRAEYETWADPLRPPETDEEPWTIPVDAVEPVRESWFEWSMGFITGIALMVLVALVSREEPLVSEPLTTLLPCEDPEEPCDADGRDEHRWCDYCIARSVIVRSGLTLASPAAPEGLDVERLARAMVNADLSPAEPVVDADRREAEDIAAEYQRLSSSVVTVNDDGTADVAEAS